MKILAISIGAAALILPGTALAQVTQSYTYDANGRLTGVVTAGGAATHTSTYAYDDANNRTARSQTGATAWAAILRLPANKLLQPDEALVSPDGRYSFAFRDSGRMELWAGDVPVEFDTRPLVSAFDLADDGQARFAPALSAASSLDAAWVSLRDDGRLTLLDEAGEELWRSGEATGREVAQ